jgi:hypothetical protein
MLSGWVYLDFLCKTIGTKQPRQTSPALPDHFRANFCRVSYSSLGENGF